METKMAVTNDAVKVLTMPATLMKTIVKQVQPVLLATLGLFSNKSNQNHKIDLMMKEIDEKNKAYQRIEEMYQESKTLHKQFFIVGVTFLLTSYLCMLQHKNSQSFFESMFFISLTHALLILGVKGINKFLKQPTFQDVFDHCINNKHRILFNNLLEETVNNSSLELSKP